MPNTIPSPPPKPSNTLTSPLSRKIVAGVVALIFCVAAWLLIQSRGELPTPVEAANTSPQLPDVQQLQAGVAVSGAVAKEQAQTPELAQTPQQAAQLIAATQPDQADPAPSISVQSALELPAPTISVAEVEDAHNKPQPVSEPSTMPARQLKRLFKVQGIFHGPAGARAIINGRKVKSGDKVDNATVIQIDTNSVDLDVDGRLITVGL